MSKVSADVSEDEVEECPSSGEDWRSAKKNSEKKRITRRTSQRLRKKPRRTVTNSSDSENEKVEVKKKGRTPAASKKGKNSQTSGPGGFLVLKKDLQTGDTTKQPCLWRIDGKALLQKYETFDMEGKVLHRSTSIYTGWSPLDKDLYSPVEVQIRWNTNQEMAVELDWETLKNATMESD